MPRYLVEILEGPPQPNKWKILATFELEARNIIEARSEGARLFQAGHGEPRPDFWALAKPVRT